MCAIKLFVKMNTAEPAPAEVYLPLPFVVVTCCSYANVRMYATHKSDDEYKNLTYCRVGILTYFRNLND
jgi:hypothetical protein